MLKKLESKAFIMGLTLICASILYSIFANRNYSMIAENVVIDLYTYDNDEQCMIRLQNVKRHVSEDVYLQLTTIDDLTNFNYIQWKKDSISVNVIKSTSSYVLYSLEGGTYEGRRFIFMYDTDIFGKIIAVRECELNDFIEYSESVH